MGAGQLLGRWRRTPLCVGDRDEFRLPPTRPDPAQRTLPLSVKGEMFRHDETRGIHLAADETSRFWATSDRMSCWRCRSRDLAIAQRCRRVEQPVQHFTQLTIAAPSRRIEIASGVVDGTCQDVEIVAQRVEFGASHDEISLAQCQFAGPLARHPVPLPARLPAELLLASRLCRRRQDTSTPAAPHQSTVGPRSPFRTSALARFRHDEIITLSVGLT